jgi:hypothetical protein
LSFLEGDSKQSREKRAETDLLINGCKLSFLEELLALYPHIGHTKTYTISERGEGVTAG